MSALIKKLEAIGQNAEMRYAKRPLNLDKLISSKEMKAIMITPQIENMGIMVTPSDECRAIFFVEE